MVSKISFNFSNLFCNFIFIAFIFTNSRTREDFYIYNRTFYPWWYSQ